MQDEGALNTSGVSRVTGGESLIFGRYTEDHIVAAAMREEATFGRKPHLRTGFTGIAGYCRDILSDWHDVILEVLDGPADGEIFVGLMKPFGNEWIEELEWDIPRF